MPNSKVRFFILKLMMLVMMCAIIWTLFKLQILEGKQYKEVADNRITINQVEKAPEEKYLTVTELLLCQIRSDTAFSYRRREWIMLSLTVCLRA